MNKNKKKPKVGIKLYISFFIVLNIFMYLASMAYQNARRLSLDVKAVEATHQFMGQIQSFTALLRDTETAHNAYLILGKERYLKIYNQNVTRLGAQLDLIKSRLPLLGLSTEGEGLQGLIARKIEDMNQAAWERDKRGFNYAIQVFLTGRWQKLSDAIQKNLDVIDVRQQQVLNYQLQKKSSSVTKTVSSVIMGVVASIIFFFIAFWIIHQDLLKRLEYEEQLEIAKADALQASEFKTQFLANMSHEIRTPMNGIMGMATVLLESKLDDQQNHYAQIIKRSCEALLRIINDILDFSKVEAGKLEIAPESFDLKKLLQELEALFSTIAEKKSIKFHLRVDGSVPDAVIGDGGRLRQILNNLVANSIKFTERGKVSLTVNVQSIKNSVCTLRFEVTDTGIGIPEEHQSKIFGQFQQADAATGKRFGGTGLGLSISKKLVELMNGQIGFSSQVGVGSTFWFELGLPIGVAVKNQDQKMQSIPIYKVGARALVAEDDLVNQEVITKYLERLSIQAELVMDGEAAITKFTPETYDFLFLDFSMPLLNGIEVLEKIRSSEKNGNHSLTPAFLVTANVSDDARLRWEDLKGNGVIHKPIQFDIFKSEVERIFLSVKQGCKILIADDSDVNHDLIKIYLGPYDYRIDFVFDGKAALEQFKKQKYDLVLMDVQMPVMGGIEAVGLIRAWEKQTQSSATTILAFTGGVTEEEIKTCLDGGYNDYIEKPIGKEKFLAIVSKHLQKEKQTQPDLELEKTANVS